MNSISHQRAREWIQVRLDRQLDETKISALNAHLQDCAACRAYAARIEYLDSALRQAYREHVSVSPISNPSLSTDSAIHSIHKQMRLKMKSKQIMNVATSFSAIVGLAALVIGFSWLISTRGKMILPGAGGNPISSFTPTPFPWTESNPLTAPDQIEAILNDLANKNVNAFLQSDWVHVLRKDMAQPGMIHSSYSDSWFHYPKEDQSCIEGLELVRDRPEASTQFLQILVSLPDGAFGDLIQLRSGDGQITHLEPGFSGCSLKPEFASAGQFAVRIKGEQSAAQNEKMAVKAWYAMLDGRSVFIVSATFTQPSKANYTGITKETRTFDAETGVIVQEDNRMEWADGSLFGESLQGYETEFLSELPADVAVQFQQFSTELKSYANGTVVHPIPTRTPETSPVPVVEDQQFISETAPLTDGQTILRILHALKQYQIEKLSKPGWYVYGPHTPDPDQWMSNRYLLTHTLDQNGVCEYMSYYIKDGKILPQEVTLSDGHWGLIGPVESGEFGTGGKGQIPWSNGPVTDTCQVQNTETVSFIQNETDYFQDIVDGKTQGIYKAWTEEIRSRKLFVLYYDIQVNGLGTVMDPDTRKLEPIDHTQTWVYFDLNWGTVLYEAGEQVFNLQNGKTIGSAPAPDKTIDVGYTYYKELPTDLKEVYDKTVTALEAYLQK